MSTTPTQSSPHHRRSKSGSLFRAVTFGRVNAEALDDGKATNAAEPPSPRSVGAGAIKRRNTSKSSGNLSSLSKENRFSFYGSDDKRSPKVNTQINSGRPSISDSNPPSPSPSSPATGSRPSFNLSRRSILGSIRGLRSSEEDTPPSSALSTASRSSSFHWRDSTSKDDLIDIGQNRTVLHSGEAVTNSGIFFKKREYLVLTETHLVKFKTQGRASEVFKSISPYPGKQAIVSQAAGLRQADDDDGANPEVSSERATAIPLDRIVAVFPPEEGRLTYALHIYYLDANTSMLLQIELSDAGARDTWLKVLRQAADRARLADTSPIEPRVAEYAARVVEREMDYDVDRFYMYKIVKRASPRSSAKSSGDELVSKQAATVCYLVIGIHKVHIIHPANRRQSTLYLGELGEGGSFGILNLAWILVNNNDDNFQLAFRSPFQQPKTFHLSSLAAAEIALRLRQCDAYLRPLCLEPAFTFVVPDSVHDEPIVSDPHELDLGCFDRTLMAYCISYGVNPAIIRYTVNYNVEDSPRFELLAPDRQDDQEYAPLEILAIMRSLRHNETFHSISFAGIMLDSLRVVKDTYDKEDMYSGHRFNEAMGLSNEGSARTANILVLEIRAIAMTNSRLRRMDFSYCFAPPRDVDRTFISGCDFIEALTPICRNRKSNLDWIALNGIWLTGQDVERLVDIASNQDSHLRALELIGCNLQGQQLNDLVNALSAQDTTLETLEIADNPGLRITPLTFGQMLSPFAFIRKLNLSHACVVQDGTPLLPIELLMTWRLEELWLRGVVLDDHSIPDLCQYLASSQSEVLRELDLSNCSLNGFQAHDLMQSMSREPGIARYLHLNLSDNNLERGHDAMVSAIGKGFAPTQLSMRSIQYNHDESLRKLFSALAINQSLRFLDLSQLFFPGPSVETFQAIEHFLTNNETLEELDISAEHTRLMESVTLTKELRLAIGGLRHNHTLQTLRVKHQMLGDVGIRTIANMLKDNKTLRCIQCEHNDVTLSGFTYLVNSLVTNTTILRLPFFEEARDKQLRDMMQEITKAQEEANIVPNNARPSTIRRAFTSLNNMTGSTQSPSKPAAPKFAVASVPLTDQGVSAALQDVQEAWNRQMRRLQLFLERNSRLAYGEPIDDLEAELRVNDINFDVEERPGTAASNAKVFEKVAMQTTPTAEKIVELGTKSPLTTTVSAPSLSTPQLKAYSPTTEAVSPRPKALSPLDKASSFFLKTPPTSPRKNKFSPGVQNGPFTPPSQTASLRSKASALDEVQIDQTPIFASNDDVFGLGSESNIRSADSMTLATPSEMSPNATREPSGEEKRDSTDQEEEVLMMAASPRKKNGNEGFVGLGLNLGDLSLGDVAEAVKPEGPS